MNGRRQPTYNIIFSRDRCILRAAPLACRQTCDLCAEIRIAEECDRLSRRGDALCITDLLGGRRDDAVEGRAQDVVAPAGEQIARVHDDRARLLSDMRGVSDDFLTECGHIRLVWPAGNAAYVGSGPQDHQPVT